MTGPRFAAGRSSRAHDRRKHRCARRSATSSRATSLAVAGRTDTGVHALGERGHRRRRGRPAAGAGGRGAERRASAGRGRPCAPRRRRPDFHARHSATAARYRYRIWRRATRSPFESPARSGCRARSTGTARRGGRDAPRRARLPRVHPDRRPSTRSSSGSSRTPAGTTAATASSSRSAPTLPAPHGAHAGRDDARAVTDPLAPLLEGRPRKSGPDRPAARALPRRRRLLAPRLEFVALSHEVVRAATSSGFRARFRAAGPEFVALSHLCRDYSKTCAFRSCSSTSTAPSSTPAR